MWYKNPNIILNIFYVLIFIFILLLVLIFVIKPKFVITNINIFWIIEIILLQILTIGSQIYKHIFTIDYAKGKLESMLLTPSELKDVKKKLNSYKKLEAELKNASISKQRFDETLKFFESSEEEQARIFTNKIDIKGIVKEGIFWRIYLDDSFNLNMDTFLLYISNDNVKKVLDDIGLEHDMIFVIGSEKEQKNITKVASCKSNLIIAPPLEVLSMLLLFENTEDSRDILIWMFSNCLLTKYLSPYQVNSGVTNESNFFGRVEIIRDIVSKENANYLIVGARQLGKSSIIKALERRYEESSKVDCYSFTMDDANIVAKMATALKLGVDASLDDIVKTISSAKKKSIFLIDEADKFVKNEKENDYKITEVFRKLSQEGKATFVLTGFWTLYFAVTSDYHSPLKNFGELIKLEGLDEESCKALMTEPMKRIGVSYENESIVENVIKLCGKRPNLIAITCNEVLKTLDGKVITQKEIDEVFENSSLEDYLKGWGSMSSSDTENQLDRVIIYLTLETESFRLADVVRMLKERGLELDVNRINSSLDRLVVAYLLQERKKNYSYRVPLFREKLLEDDVEILLDGDLGGLR